MGDVTEAQAHAKIRSTFDALERDRQRWTTAPPSPAGSELAEDDQVWPSSPLSQHVRQCLVSAWDHFDLARLTIEQKRTFPTAIYSVLRGALLGAAHARWLLLPDDPARRRERGLAIAQEWYLRRIQWQEAFIPDREGEDLARCTATLRRLKADRQAVTELWTEKFQLNATDIIRESAAATFKNDSLTREVVREWRRLGGDAHALGWTFMTQRVSWVDPAKEGLSEARVVADLSSVANAFLVGWQIYRDAISRFDELSTPAG